MAEAKKTSKKTGEAKPKKTKAAATAPEPAATATGEDVAKPTAPAVPPQAAKAAPESTAQQAKKTAEVSKEEKTGAPAAARPDAGNLSLSGEIEKPKIVKAKGSKNVHSGIAHVLSTFNNTIVTITDMTGKVIGWSSAGKVGFKGSRKSTAYAAQMVAQDASRQAMGHGLKEVEVRVKGPGAGRESAVRALQAVGLDLTIIRDVTPVPHNGCRPPKQRRV